MPSWGTTEVQSVHFAELELRFHKLGGIPTGTLKWPNSKGTGFKRRSPPSSSHPPHPLDHVTSGQLEIPSKAGWEHRNAHPWPVEDASFSPQTTQSGFHFFREAGGA